MVYARKRRTRPRKRSWRPRRTWRRRRTNWRRSRGRRSRVGLTSIVGGNTNVKYVRMRYCATVASAAGAGAGLFTTPLVFRMNSVYDPDFSGVGGTVQYYSQYANLYRHYRVMKARIRFYINAPSGTGPHWALTKLDDDGTTFSGDMNLWMSDPSVRRKQFQLSAAYTYGYVSRYFDPAKYWGKNRAMSDATGSSIGTNPSEQAFCGIAFVDCNGGTAAAFTVRVEIDYLVKWSELRDIYNP